MFNYIRCLPDALTLGRADSLPSSPCRKSASLSRYAFMQEDMTFKGVVFNEMKGVYSSPDSTNSRLTQRSLFPDNTYAVDSGGDPTVIPELSFDEFRAFHGRYYHPSNARFWFYGDDNPQERLRIMDRALQGFEARPVDSSVTAQPLFKVRRPPWPCMRPRGWTICLVCCERPSTACAWHADRLLPSCMLGSCIVWCQGRGSTAVVCPSPRRWPVPNIITGYMEK